MRRRRQTCGYIALDRGASSEASSTFHLQLNARLARNPEGVTNSLPFMSGVVASARNGDGDGRRAISTSSRGVSAVRLDVPVYDLDIEGVHNFIANGLVTHNSIYSFRGADVRNILDFQDDFPDARVVKLEQNYRSTETILAAANAVIANNRGGIAKRLWSELGQGEQIQLRALEDEHAEARFVVGEIERLRRRGRLARGDRGALPHERDVAGDRGHARAARDRLPGDRRHEVLRARRDQGRDRLPVAARQPVRRGQLHARRQLARGAASGRPRWRA